MTKLLGMTAFMAVYMVLFTLCYATCSFVGSRVRAGSPRSGEGQRDYLEERVRVLERIVTDRDARRHRRGGQNGPQRQVR